MQLLETGFVDRVIINDIDPAIFSFWRAVLNTSDQFCQLLHDTPITVEEWHRQSAIWKDGPSQGELKLGFATYFLNRTNRSGIIAGAGPIGGYSQSGNWKIDARLVKEKQIANLKRLARNADRIEVSNEDAIPFIERSAGAENALLYLDPPYFVKGRKLYTNFYEADDHAAIASLMVKHRGARWVVSYDDVPEIRALYSAFDPIAYSLQYSAGRAGIGAEVMYVSDALAMPPLPSKHAA